MILSERFDGTNTPFEGDIIYTLRSLPEGAVVSKAVLRVKPVSRPSASAAPGSAASGSAASGSAPFEETIQFGSEQNSWGATQVQGIVGNDPTVEVDFHARRTLSRIDGANLEDANLQVDMGGLLVEISATGGVKTPDDDFFELPAGGVTPSLTVNKFVLRQPVPDGQTGSPMTITRVVVRSLPTNLTASLGTLPTFWARPGELARVDTSPDFSPILQAFLQDAVPQAGFYTIPLTLHSDSIARLEVTVEIEYVVQQPALPGGLTETTLPYDFSSTPKSGSASIQVSLPPGARVIPEQTRAHVRGIFQETRVVFGPTGPLEPVAVASLTPAVMQAQSLLFESDLAATSVDLLLTSITRTASLNLNIMEDVDGKVWNQPLLSRPVVIALDRDIAQSATWINAALPAEFQFKGGVRYWLVIQCLSGEAAWSVSGAGNSDTVTSAAGTGGSAIGMQSSSDGGLSWRTTSLSGVSGPVEAYFRLRNTPQRFTMPLELEIGSGDGAVRLDLKRFEPLGRVDFDLDPNDLAAAFNQYLAVGGGGLCPLGEHIENRDFTDWRRTSSTLSAPEALRISGTAMRIAISTDGCLGFIATIDFTGTSAPPPVNLQRINVLSDDVFGGTLTVDGVVNALVCSPDGNKAFMLLENDSGHHLVIDDPESGEPFQRLSLFELTPHDLAISPDGNSLYLAAYFTPSGGGEAGRIYRANPTALEAALRAGQTDWETLFELFLDLGEEQPPTAIAITPDGSQLLLGVTRNDQGGAGELAIVDAESAAILGSRLPLGSSPIDLAVSAAGVHALVVCEGGDEVFYANLVTRQVEPIRLEAGGAPSAAAIMPEGDIACVTLQELALLSVVDLQEGRQVRTIPIGASPLDIAITPAGERILIADQVEGEQTAMTLIRVGLLLPEEWTLTAGRVMPYCFEAPFGRVALLGDAIVREPSMTSGLSQVVPVSGGCRYEFSFWGIASEVDAVGEVLWIGSDCRQAGQEQIPITAFDQSKLRRQRRDADVELSFHRKVFEIPEGVTQAEVRFRTPAGVGAAIDQVTLKATQETVANGDLQSLENGQIAGWTVTPQNPAGVSLVSDGETVSIVNGGSSPLTLAQAAPFEAAVPFLLEISGFARRSGTARGNPAAEVTWLDADGHPVGAPARMEILPDSAERQALRGSSPAQTAQAELRLSVPPGATLGVRQVSLAPQQTVDIPVTFIAQAPGELTVMDWNVAYEMGEPAAAPLPPGGLCAPTRPEGIPGEGDDCCYCPCCHHSDPLEDDHETRTPSGRPAHAGRCSHCGCQVVTSGGRPAPGPVIQPAPGPVGTVGTVGTVATAATLTAVEARPSLVVHRLAPAIAVRRAFRVAAATELVAAALEPVAAAPEPVAAILVELPPLTAVNGIADSFASRLREMNIDSIEKLAAAQPGEIAAIRGVSKRMAANWIEEAKRLHNLAVRKNLG